MALSGAASNGFGQAPMNVAGVVKEAGNFDYDPNIPLRYWFRTADAIQKQVRSRQQHMHSSNING
jgi:STAM-binding protein